MFLSYGYWVQGVLLVPLFNTIYDGKTEHLELMALSYCVLYTVILILHAWIDQCEWE